MNKKYSSNHFVDCPCKCRRIVDVFEAKTLKEAKKKALNYTIESGIFTVFNNKMEKVFTEEDC